MNPILNPRAAGHEGSLIGIPGMTLSVLRASSNPFYLFFVEHIE